MISAAGANRRGPSSIPVRAEHESINFSDTVNLLLKADAGRGGRPGWAISSAPYASAKTREWKGSISSNCLVVIVAGSNCRGPSSIPERVKRQSINSFDIINFLLKANGGRGGRPD